MKKWFLLPVCLYLFSLGIIRGMESSDYALGADRIEEKLIPAGKSQTIEIENISGLIEVSSWKNDQVKIFAQLGEDVEKLIIEEKENRIYIKIKLPRNKNIDHGDAVLKIQIPEICYQLFVSSISADIKLSGIQTNLLESKSISGDIDLEVEAESIKLNSISGDIIFRTVTGVSASVQTVSGDINCVMEKMPGDIQSLNTQTVSGDIKIDNCSLQHGSFNSTSGDIEFKGTVKEPGSLTFKTLSGEIDLFLPADLPALFDISSFSGRIEDKLFYKDPEKTSEYTSEKKLRYSNGKESIRISIETFSGDVAISKKL